MDERTPLPSGEHFEPEPDFNPLIDDFEPKVRSYLHFDLPPSAKRLAKITHDSQQVKKHSFYPFLGFTALDRRYKRVEGKKQIQEKPRDIRYASHLDSAIYEYYASIISALYEEYLEQEGLSSVVLAYRSNIGSNIDHAASLFDEITARGACTCIALDIKGFFDNLNHAQLKDAWCAILGADKLPDDHFKIYRSLTKYNWVSKEDIEKRLGRKISAKVGGRICSPKEFREKIRGQKPSIIFPHDKDFGIPQGSSLSGLLANIYLHQVDQNIFHACKEVGASYRRYSDDIAIVTPPTVETHSILKVVYAEFEKMGLKINETKTEIVKFTPDGAGQSAEKPFQYLGFTYDGKRKLIRDSSLNRYYKKMTRAIRATRLTAERKGIPLKSVFLRRHYKTYTHKGKGRNFVRYAYRAASKLEAPEIRRQLRRHTRNFQARILKEFGQVNE